MEFEFCSVSATSGLCERWLSTRSTPYAEQEVRVPFLEVRGRGNGEIRGYCRIEEFDDADADLVAHVGQVGAAPADGVVGAAGKPGVFRVEVLRLERRREMITATLVTRAETLFITVGILMMDDIIEGSVITGIPKSESSSRSCG